MGFGAIDRVLNRKYTGNSCDNSWQTNPQHCNYPWKSLNQPSIYESNVPEPLSPPPEPIILSPRINSFSILDDKDFF